jgi:hypothetical protein
MTGFVRMPWHLPHLIDPTSAFFSAGAVFWVWLNPRDPETGWPRVHRQSMDAAHIRTATMFLAVNLRFPPQAVAFILPGFLGVPVVGWTASRYGRGLLAPGCGEHRDPVLKPATGA